MDSRFQDENQLGRLKNILFPKQENKKKYEVKMNDSIPSKHVLTSYNNNHDIRTSIDKLRKQITNVLTKKIGKNDTDCPAEKIYLDGIHKITKQLDNNTSQIRQAFDQFLSHLPTRISSSHSNYQNDYFLSMLIQNSLWSKLQNISKRSLLEAFGQIKAQSFRKRSILKQLNVLEKSKQQKNKNKTFMNILKYFNVWRYKNCCFNTKQISDNYLKQNSLDHDKMIIKNLMNLPYLVMMLEEYGKQSSDAIELILVQENYKKCCKYVEENQSYINTSLETVTHRSLLYTEREQIKFKRYEFQLIKSLTKNCIQRGEIMFISNLSKNPDFSQIDNICLQKIQQINNNEFLKGSAVFYPLFNQHNKCIAVLRTYFYENSQRVIPGKIIQKISLLLELGLNIDHKMKDIFVQKEYQTQGYFLKFINIIKFLQQSQGSTTQTMRILSQELSSKLNIKKTSIYRVNLKQLNSREYIIENLYGYCQDQSFLLSLLDQIIKQESNYIYLQNRLIIYSKMMLFDLELNDKIKEQIPTIYQTQLKLKLLPIDLIVKFIIKAQNIIVEKEQRCKLLIQNQKIKMQHQQKLLLNNIRSLITDNSLEFLGNLGHNDQSLYDKISIFIKQTYKLLTNNLKSNKEYKVVQFYLECLFSKMKKDITIVDIAKNEQVNSQIKYNWRQYSKNMLTINLSESLTLYIDLDLSIYEKVQDILENFLCKFTHKYLNIKIERLCKGEDIDYLHIMQKFLKQSQNDDFFNMNKRSWQLIHIQRIYEAFGQIIKYFVANYFGINDNINFQNSKPEEKNIEQWKQIIYNFVCSQPEEIVIDLIHNNDVISNLQYKKLSMLTSFTFNQINKETLMIIYNSKAYSNSNYSSYDSLKIKIPMYYVKQSQQNNESLKLISKFHQIKLIFKKLAYTLIDGISNINYNQKQQAMIKMNDFCRKTQLKRLRQGLQSIKKQYKYKLKNIENFRNVIHILNSYLNKMQIVGFHKIQLYSHYKKQKALQKINDYSSLNKLSSILGKILFKFSYQKIIKKANNKLIIIKLCQKTNQIYNKMKIDKIDMPFQQIFYSSKKSSKISIFNQSIKKILQNTSFKFFHSIKLYSESLYYNMKAQKQQFNKIQKCSSLMQLKQEIRNFVPEFRVFLSYDEQFCYTLYSPLNQNVCVELQHAYNPPDGYISYQFGTTGQLIWNYNLKKDEDCFKLKDKLSRISKFVQISIEKCKQQLSIKCINLSIFKRNWLRMIQTRILKRWKNQSNALFMNEKNRLNDSLYQLSIQSQTMKQKLKGQQKLLKYNLTHYQQEQKKQQQYKQLIQKSQNNIHKIEQCQFTLQNTKSLYETLSKRTILKNVILLWKNNASLVKYYIIKAKRLKNYPFFNIGLKSMTQILHNKQKNHLKVCFFKISAFRKVESLKVMEIKKLDVEFENIENPRLMTFNSYSDQQQQIKRQRQNSYQNKNILRQFTGKMNNRQNIKRSSVQKIQLTEQQFQKHRNGSYKLNPKTLKFLKRMGKLDN